MRFEKTDRAPPPLYRYMRGGLGEEVGSLLGRVFAERPDGSHPRGDESGVSSRSGSRPVGANLKVVFYAPRSAR